MSSNKWTIKTIKTIIFVKYSLLILCFKKYTKNYQQNNDYSYSFLNYVTLLV